MSEMEEMNSAARPQVAGLNATSCFGCGGQGYHVETEYGHDCGGDDRLCQSRCPVPVPVQVACEACGGSGVM